MSSLGQESRRQWAQRILDVQSRRAPEETDAARSRIEQAREHEACARKCKAVKGLAVRSRALAAEGLRQMADPSTSGDLTAVRDRWQSAQAASRARQERRCSRLEKRSKACRRRMASRRARSSSSSHASSSERISASRQDNAASPVASVCSNDSFMSVLRAGSESEEEAMVEAAMLVGAADVASLAAMGGDGMETWSLPRVERHSVDLSSETEDIVSDSEDIVYSVSDSDDTWPSRAASSLRSEESSVVQDVLDQLRVQPADDDQCAAKFSLYETYSSEVESMRKMLLSLHHESRSVLPRATAVEMDRRVGSIDNTTCLQIPDYTREWFVYHMMRQAERNNFKMGAILHDYEKKLKFLAASDQVECPVCLELFDEDFRRPETLSCCHKVCAECWQNWTKTTHGRPFCPFCRHDEFLSAVAQGLSCEGGYTSDSE